MSEPAKTDAELIAAIKEVKCLELARLESIRSLRRLADSLIANPATPLETIAAIEQQFETIRAANVAHNELMQQVSARYTELLSEGEVAA